mmetsp:Transcript_11166/g.26836  ORF Transcript_11166/g.26836 Transcript_11166/m.26836 type:complete len:215 (+) Transcript_11166:121-765(+)|eukprot:CAMPEP_0197182906 /NCGR_PEP_ID=MMETSP1423-20130617/7007_1 /TAXON_ID=476441 /ORGANISM="Pseudo-nitzschia heimii, Strain UNC1101" /LENGTH=214 /DNA_ID=CAMNT_0042633409 /DNA_START=104 /DNA_END=748 /DNA_ORIENTATION=+
MIFNKSTALALAAAPLAVSSWSIGPSYYSTPLSFKFTEIDSPVERVLKKQRTIVQRAFNQQVGYPSNRYQLIDNDEKFQLTVDVPGVKEEDIDIKLDDGQLTVTGQRRSVSEFSRFASKFSQSFYLDPTVDVDSFTATLTDGVLVVSAPKELSKLEENVRRIPITPLEDIVGEEHVYEDTDASVEDKTEKERDIPVDSNGTDAENKTPDNSNDE